MIAAWGRNASWGKQESWQKILENLEMTHLKGDWKGSMYSNDLNGYDFHITLA